MYPIKVINAQTVKIDIKEALRYMGYGKADADESTLCLSENIKEELHKIIIPKACFIKVPVRIENNEVNLDFLKTKSTSLSKNLYDCNEAIVFCATIGIEVDRLILKYEQLSSSKAVIADALASAAIESWCDEINMRFCKEEQKKNLYLKPRFSCGYGDFDISCQKDILNILDSARKIGVNLSQGSMMIPTKSVSAVIGITSKMQNEVQGCNACENKENCLYKKAE